MFVLCLNWSFQVLIQTTWKIRYRREITEKLRNAESNYTDETTKDQGELKKKILPDSKDWTANNGISDTWGIGAIVRFDQLFKLYYRD